MIQKWKYRVAKIPHIEHLEQQLNEISAEGWEFYTHIGHTHLGGLLIFRRPGDQQSQQANVEHDEGSQL